MSDDTLYLSALSNITTKSPTDIDDLMPASGKAHGANPLPHMKQLPSGGLWTLDPARNSRFGIRITESPGDATELAARLAAIAIERNVYPVILSHIGRSGLQRFGYRVEHVAGETEQERARSEEEIRRFWNLALIVDATEISAMG